MCGGVRFAPDAGPSCNTAILLLDFQNEFVRAGGALHKDVEESMVDTGMLQKVPQVVRAARKSGALMLHSRVVMELGSTFMDEDSWNHMNAYGAQENLFLAGTWNCEFADEVKPKSSDIILENRNAFSAFKGTDLQAILEARGVQRLCMMGFLSNVCVEETTIEASELFPDMSIYVCMDGCAAKSKQDHYVAMGNTLPLFASVITCAEAQSLLSMSTPSGEYGNEKTSDCESLIRRPSAKLTCRPRIPALHGAKSNNEVTRIQLQNLNITEEDYDIVYLRGGVEAEEAHPDLEGLIRGPYYSWFCDNEDDQDGGATKKSIINAVKDVVSAVQQHGPFDGIYGFSSGAVVASLIANLSRDTALQDLISMSGPLDGIDRFSGFLSRKSSIAIPTSQPPGHPRRLTRRGKKSSIATPTSHRRKSSQNRRSSIFGTPQTVLMNQLDLSEPLIKFVILACAAPDVSTIRRAYAPGTRIQQEIEVGTIPVNSFHMIGIEDGYKAQSEKIASLYADKSVLYMPGGHAVSREAHLDVELTTRLRKFARSLGHPNILRAEPLKYTPTNEVSSVHLSTEYQVALVKLKHDALPEGLYEGGATIAGALQAQPASKPFLYNARVEDVDAATSYGDVLSFIHGGKGDLRALGVDPGEVVAYGSPPGGSAAAALAFLSIGAQTTAAPLAPGTTKPDALDALDQFSAKHLILFEGVDCPGVEAAFQEYALSGKAKLHTAVLRPDVGPGMFEYKTAASFERTEALVNGENGICLLLRTSGTTARPKGVPLSQGGLITNGAIIAKAMQLTDSDVCYSVMPLFHIGGISASILCTLTSGGAVCCDEEPFDPGRMVDALALSRPQPTWYSSVPTIHNATVSFLKTVAARDLKYSAYGIDSRGIWLSGHSLRMIRSGAAALLGPDGQALAAAYGGIPIYPTYSMSEQMPISQPPAGKADILVSKPGSVGVPVAASVAIVSRATLRPQPPGVEGEIAISGPTVLKNYLANPAADQKSYFYLSLDEAQGHEHASLPYFLTGDVGVLDRDGFLSLKGRSKELIKKGGEQVSPFEVEEPLLDHPWVQTPLCFGVPSQLYGEEVGCALVLSPQCPVAKDGGADTLKKVTAEMRAWLKAAKLAPLKWPTKWILVNDDQLPKTKTKKYVRIGLSTHLGLDPTEDVCDLNTARKQTKTAKVDWKVIGSFRFVLACYVMFMHIGSKVSWGSLNNLRGWPWHVHVFFTLGGYSMASPMNPAIQKKFSYFLARIGNMYPMYCVALLFGLINLLVVCRPSTFRPTFHWQGQPDDLYLEDGSAAPLFCEGTPAFPDSYWGSLSLTIATYLFGLTVTPFWPINWWLGYYLWFSSMYYCCLACFPVTYNYFYQRTRKNTVWLLQIIAGLLLLNAAIITGAWYCLKDMEGYDHYSFYDSSGQPIPQEDHTDDTGVAQNVGVLSFYLFGSFWQLYFVIGVAAAFWYDAYRPAERHTARNWGWLADLITLLMIAKSVAIILQGVQEGSAVENLKYMRPDAADQHTDSSNANRLWDNASGRLMAPVTTLWIVALSTGEGFTAAFLRAEFLSRTLAPNAYNCFLFHQMVGQWYYAVTRNGHWWNWWRYRKSFYWFSPEPCPVEWYEYFYVVGLVVGFSSVMTSLEPLVAEALSNLIGLFIAADENDDDEDTGKVLCEIIEGMTGIEPMMDYTLEECGLASIGVPVLVGLLNKNFSTKTLTLTISASDLVSAQTIGDMVDVVDASMKLAENQGV